MARCKTFTLDSCIRVTGVHTAELVSRQDEGMQNTTDSDGAFVQPIIILKRGVSQCLSAENGIVTAKSEQIRFFRQPCDRDDV